MPVAVKRDVFYDAGRQACRHGVKRDRCPYPAGFSTAERWLRGWDEMAPLVAAERAANDNQARIQMERLAYGHEGHGIVDREISRTPWSATEDEELLTLLDPALRLNYENIAERLSRPLGSICSRISVLRRRPETAHRVPPKRGKLSAVDRLADDIARAAGKDIIHSATPMPKGWTVDMIAELASRAKQKYTVYAMAKAVGRTETEVAKVCDRLGFEIDAWSVQDRSQLRALSKTKKTTAEIAEIMQRSRDDVDDQLRAMRAQDAERNAKRKRK